MISGLEAHRLLRLLIDGRILGRVIPEAVGPSPDAFVGVEVSQDSLNRWMDTQADQLARWPEEWRASLLPEARPFLPAGTALADRIR